MFRTAATRSIQSITRSIPKRAFTQSVIARNAAGLPTSLQAFTEEELMLKDTVARFAQEVVKPKVLEMDETEKVDPAVLKGLFEQGLMGIETDAEYDGANCSFMSAIITIEELAKVDPSISVLCDVQVSYWP
ncbi:Putative Acyl-CoA dehydrogenase [Rhizopus microsporus]|nr:Putative Acyl-CoA dehydrogenase [Rhizopus microsporus]